MAMQAIFQHTPIARLNALCLCLLLLCVVIASADGQAAPARLLLSSDSNLRFGTFAVMDRGYRTVSPTGNVQSVGIFSTSTGDTSPARFTLAYDRGNNSRRNLNLRIQLVLSPAPVVTQNGVVARLSSYQTDLPGAANVQAGQVVEVLIPNCRQRVCSRSFNVGARLDVERNFGGASIEIPIPADAVLISVK